MSAHERCGLGCSTCWPGLPHELAVRWMRSMMQAADGATLEAKARAVVALYPKEVCSALDDLVGPVTDPVILARSAVSP